MALFGKKTDSEKKQSAKKTAKSAPALATNHTLEDVLVRPRLSEKSVVQGEHNVYTFTVRKDANKYQVRDAVKALYKVTPVKVNIVNKKPDKRFVGSRGRMKHVPGMKKAYVYLKKGDTINLV